MKKIFKELVLRNFLKSFFGITKDILIWPKGFFKIMPPSGGYGGPVLYLGLCFLIWGVLKSVTLLNPFFLMVALVSFFFSFLGSAILLFILRKVFEVPATYEGVFRITAYSSAVNLLSWIPLIGFLFSLYGLWIRLVGLETVYGVSKIQALVAVALSFIVFFIITLPIGGFIFIWA